MKIQTSPVHGNKMYTNNIKNNKNTNKKISEKLASGKKINRASDDAAALAISKKLESQIRRYDAGSVNIKSGINLTNIADGAMSGISDSLNDLEANAIRAMNGTMSESDRKILQQANEETIKTIDHITNTTNYNGKKLLDGSNKDINIYTGNSMTGVNGADVTSKALGLENFSVENAESIDLSKIDEALKSVSSARSKMGAQANGLEASLRSNQITTENTVAADSRISDTDMAKASMEKKASDTLGAAQVLMMRNQMKNNEGILGMF